MVQLKKEDLIEAIQTVKEFIESDSEDIVSYSFILNTKRGTCYSLMSCNEGFEDITLEKLNRLVETIRNMKESYETK